MECRSTVVSLSRCSGYNPTDLRKIIDRVLEPLILPPLSGSTRVLLKPNLISVKCGTLACTEAEFILAVADWFLERGVRLSLGDSPAFGTALHILRKLDLFGRLRQRGVHVCDFKEAVPVQLSSGVRIGVAREVLETDLLVNIPRVKAHGQVLMTMAVKNCFGCVVGMRKPWLHMVHGGSHGQFPVLLAELLDVLPSTLSVLDGVVAMHGTGPIRGKEYHLGLIGASMNPVALDSAFYQIIGVDPHRVPLWHACRHTGKVGLNLEELVYPLERPDDVLVDDFQVPDLLSPIRFRPFRFVRNSIKRLFS